MRSATPDKNDFPDFDDNLRQAFERELDLFFGSIIREDRSVLDLLTADYTFVNERLARHYGMPNVYGSHFRRVVRSDETRRGLLGKGGILLVTSHADRTSPVVRGKWILDNLIGSPPPPPPPDVPALPETDGAQPLTMRERMEQHRANPACASCHNVMDPLGLALENFDAVGAWRTRDAGQPIDASGELSDGTQARRRGRAARGAAEAAGGARAHDRREAADVRARPRSRAGRHAGRARDRAAVRDATGYRFSSLVDGVVNSVPFTDARADDACQETVVRSQG